MYTYSFGVEAAIGRPRCLQLLVEQENDTPYFPHVTTSSHALFSPPPNVPTCLVDIPSYSTYAPSKL